MRHLISVLLLSLLLLLAACGEPAAPSNRLNVTKSGDGAGTVISSVSGSATADIDCGDTCSADFVEGTTVTLTATAAEGSVLSAWSGACEGSGATCTVKMDTAQNIDVEFSAATPTTSTFTVNSSSDDAEENLTTGGVSLTSSDLEFIVDRDEFNEPPVPATQLVGLRFEGVTVPVGATITSAYLEFTVDEASLDTDDVTVTIQAEAAGNPASFSSLVNNISARPRTTASASWTLAAFTEDEVSAGTIKQTTDVAAIVQELVDLPDWQLEHAMVFIISGDTGTRAVESYDGAQSAEEEADKIARAPKLVIEYVE